MFFIAQRRRMLLSSSWMSMPLILRVGLDRDLVTVLDTGKISMFSVGHGTLTKHSVWFQLIAHVWQPSSDGEITLSLFCVLFFNAEARCCLV
jgi:hypothetical protein